MSLSSCLDVSHIKSLWTDAIVGWDINALLWLCVGVREAAVGVIAPVGVTIQVTRLSSLGGRFLGTLGVAATGVTVGVAVVSSNRRAQWVRDHVLGVA